MHLYYCCCNVNIGTPDFGDLIRVYLASTEDYMLFKETMIQSLYIQGDAVFFVWSRKP